MRVVPTLKLFEDLIWINAAYGCCYSPNKNICALPLRVHSSQAIASTGTEPPPFDELPELLKEYDGDGDGRLTFEEFNSFVDSLAGSTRKSRSSSMRAASLEDVNVGVDGTTAEATPSPAPVATATTAAAVAPPPKSEPEPEVALSPKSPTSPVAAPATVSKPEPPAEPPAAVPAAATCYSSNYEEEAKAATPSSVAPSALAAAPPTADVVPDIVPDIVPDADAAPTPTPPPAPTSPTSPQKVAMAAMAAAGGLAGGGPLPAGWEAVEDDKGRTYFWNVTTDAVLWTRPTEADATPTDAAPVPAVPGTPSAPVPDAQDAETAGLAETLSPSLAAAKESAAAAARRDHFERQIDEANAPAAAPAADKPAGVGDIAKMFAAPPADEAAAPAAAGKSALSDTMRQLNRAGVSDDDRPRSESKAGNQHKIAVAALQRKQERANDVKISSSQHAQALRGLQQAQTAGAGGGGGGGVGKIRDWEQIQKSKADASANPEEPERAQGVRAAKQAFAAKAEESMGGSKGGSQMEEALRKLHGKGVVPTKMAFGTKSAGGSQHAEAMKALQGQAGADVTTGFVKRDQVGGDGGDGAGF